MIVTNALKQIANTKTMDRVINWAVKESSAKKAAESVSNYDRLQKFYPTIHMIIGVGVQTAFIYKSEEMPKKRRIPLTLNNIIGGIIAIIGGLAIDKPTNKLVEKMVQRAKVLYPLENQTVMLNGIKTAIPYIIPALMFKYVGAVLATPLADKANNYLIKKGLVDYSNKDTAATINKSA